jgi:hypothetical protein
MEANEAPRCPDAKPRIFLTLPDPAVVEERHQTKPMQRIALAKSETAEIRSMCSCSQRCRALNNAYK